MSQKIADMTREEFREMLDVLLEQKLLEILGDPDEGLELRKSLQERLLRERLEEADGERGRPLEEVARKLDLE